VLSGRRDNTVSVVVTNTGERAGDEVVQLYLTHHDASYKAPLYALKGFERVHLAPGESRRVDFRLSERELAQVSGTGETAVRPGKVTVWVGGVSPSPAESRIVPIVSATASVRR
jgi:beta-glucosidase